MEMRKLNKYTIRKVLINILPLLALAALFVTYIIVLAVKGYNIKMSLTTIVNQSIVLVFVATGATFIFTLGQFDISLGANTLFSAVIGVLAYKASGSVAVLFLTCIGVGVACSVLNAVIASVFHLPMFVTTVAMLSVLAAVSTFLIQSNGQASGTSYSINITGDLLEKINALDNLPFKLAFLAIFIALMVFIFNFTKLGRKQKYLGGNEKCAKLTGLSVGLLGIAAFALAGLGVGIGASMTVIYGHNVSTATASSIGMSVFIAIVFGGMPISGGPRSRIYSALIGGFSYNILANILFVIFSNMGGARDGIVQIINAAFFLLIVFVASINYRTKHLPR